MFGFADELRFLFVCDDHICHFMISCVRLAALVSGNGGNSNRYTLHRIMFIDPFCNCAEGSTCVRPRVELMLTYSYLVT
jgi:hypothetical protein